MLISCELNTIVRQLEDNGISNRAGDTMMIPSEVPLNRSASIPLCSYTLLPNAVHEFVFHESSRAAVNQWIDQLAHILDTSPKASVLPIVVDTRQVETLLPVAYLIQKLRDIYLDYNWRPSMRLAFLSGNSSMIVFVQFLAELAAFSKAKRIEYYQSYSQDEAYAWLLTAE
jgi:hypothetical protein